MIVTAAAGAHDKPPVVYNAASVFMSVLVGLLSMAGLARRGMPTQIVVINLIGATVIAFTRIVQHARRSASIRTQRTTNTTPDRP